MTAKEIRNDHQRLLANLKLLQKMHTVNELAETVGVSKATWHNRMKEPWKQFSYDDLRQIATFCRVDFATLLTGTIAIR